MASLTMLSRPHPASFARAMQHDPEQPNRSRHHRELLDSGAGPRLLAENGQWVRDRLARNGVPDHPSIPHWPAYRVPERATLILDAECRVENDPGGETRALWQDIAGTR